MGFLRKRWPRSCSDLPGPACYCRITESKGGYSLARDPHQISVLEVIKAIEGAPRDGIRGKHWQPLESVAGYHQLHMVSQIVEDALGRVMISDIKEQASSPTGSCDARRC